MARAGFHQNRPVVEIADILRRHGQDYARAHAAHLGRVERRVISAITACRTAALGGHVEACDDCGVTRIAYNSCRKRHDPGIHRSRASATSQKPPDSQAERIMIHHTGWVVWMAKPYSQDLWERMV